jgi:hypothetical protein
MAESVDESSAFTTQQEEQLVRIIKTVMLEQGHKQGDQGTESPKEQTGGTFGQDSKDSRGST